MSFTLVSAAFHDKGNIPPRFTCDGFDMSPPLFWTPPPELTQSLVLIVDDPDAPDPAAPREPWVHWLLYNLPPAATSLAEGIVARDLPAGCLLGKNDWGHAAYGGPCPPIGRHRYRHILYALDVRLPDLKNPTRAVLESAMAGHILAQAELTGLYERARA